MALKILLTIWLLLVCGLIIYAVVHKIRERIKEKQLVQEKIESLEAKVQAWNKLSPESRALKRVNDSWIEEGFSRQQYTELYNKIIREERRKPSTDTMAFHKELKEWKERQEEL